MRKLPDWLESVERFVDRCIPFVLVVLTFLIVVEFSEFGEIHADRLHLLDYVVVSFFVVDLSFKMYHARNVKHFVRLHWLDILAVFPFYTIFRTAEFFLASEQVQKVLHETVLLREARFLREVELGAKISRSGRIVQFLARLFRLSRARFYLADAHMRKISKKHSR